MKNAFYYHVNKTKFPYEYKITPVMLYIEHNRGDGMEQICRYIEKSSRIPFYASDEM